MPTKNVTKKTVKKQTEKKTYLWKFLNEENGTIVSDHSNYPWNVAKWETHKGKVECCAGGFHASDKIIDALGYVKGTVLAKVEVKGKSHIEKDKQSWESMKIVKAYKWTKFDSVKLSIFAAKSVIDIYEKAYPNDDRPRKAIEAAENYLNNPNAYVAARAAAYAAAYVAARAAADAADDAYARAAVAADAAARAARAAAYAAADAAYAADDAYAAYAAAYTVAAADDAYDAARAADAADPALTKIEKWLLSHVSNLEEIK